MSRAFSSSSLCTYLLQKYETKDNINFNRNCDVNLEQNLLGKYTLTV